MQADPLIGCRIGQISLVERLGHGSVATVYRGRSQASGQEVAVKVIRDDHTQEERARFLREGQAAASIASPHVVRVFGSGQVREHLYLMMELVDGESLGGRLVASGPLSCQVAVRLGCDVAHGLSALHAHGIMHRDIKPDNILIAPGGRAKITDLGLAKLPSDSNLTSVDALVGTPLYLAPEAILHPSTISIAGDIYSLGATLFHALTGKPPFTSPDPFAVIEAKLEQVAPLLSRLHGDVPPGLVALVARCLEREPKARPTAVQAARELSVMIDERRQGSV